MRFVRTHILPLLTSSIVVGLAACGGAGDISVGDGTEADAGAGADSGGADPGQDAAAGEDAATPDTGSADGAPPDAGPKDCSGYPLAVDPPNTLDPLVAGPLAVAHATLTIPTLGPLTNAKVKVHYPVQADKVTPHPGRHAWVMFHHAVHGPYPGVTYDRYDGVFDRWASHGIITFSIDGSTVFFPPPPCGPGSTPSGAGCYTPQNFAQLGVVAGMMDAAITYVLAEQEKATFVLKCALDRARVGVAGHSRGGGAATLVKTTRADGAVVKAYVGFQPVDPEISPGAPTPPAAIPVFDIPAIWFDAGNDGDVTYPNTAMIYAHTRNRAALVTILGSKHTFTLDTPTPHQGGTPPTVTPEEHKRVTHYYSVPFLRAFLRDAAPSAADAARVAGPDGSSVPASVSSGDATLRFRPADSATGWIDRFDHPIGTTPTTTEAGGPITLSGGMAAVSYETYSGSVGTGALAQAVSRLLRSVRLNWNAGATDAAMEIALPAGAFAGRKAIVFDTAYLDSPSVTSGTHPLYLEVTDTSGAIVSLAMSSLTPASWSRRPRRLATVHVPFTRLTGIDLTKAKAIRFVAKVGTANHDVLLDVLRLE